MKPTENSGNPMVTLGAKPGNMSKPAPNHYQVYKWVSDSSLPPISLYDEPLPEELAAQQAESQAMDVDVQGSS